MANPAVIRSVAQESHSPSVVECINPATGDKIGEVAMSSAADMEEAIARAAEAQRQWAALGFAERKRFIYDLRAEFARSATELKDTICQSTGKPQQEAIAEVFNACDALTYFANNAKRFLKDESVSLRYLKNKKCIKTYYPLGVVGVISPWNAPVSLSMTPAAAALAAGNAVVLKPSEQTGLVGEAIAQIIARSGLPKDVFIVVQGDGRVGAALASSSRIGRIVFTGSAQNGRRVAQAAAANLTPVTLELGGKDPLIVLPDADLERAANAALWGAFQNAGQICMSVERAYVHKDVADRFIDLAVNKVRGLTIGHHSSGDRDLGSLSNARQLAIVEEHLADALKLGAQVKVGGKRVPGKGMFFEPTVLTHVTHEMKIMRDETFGPVLPIVVVSSEDEAVTLANDCSYGLSSAIFSKNTKRALALAHRIESGAVNVNDVMINGGMLEAPFGGVKESGLGRIHGPEGLRSFCNTRVLTTSRWPVLKREMQWFPYRPRFTNILTSAIRFFFGKRGHRS
jgi:acyl-CoA reductase-like NAD-dependent aldehyde dehydrogenase